MLGICAELISEYAKEKIWEENQTILSNQVYLFAKQYVGITRVQGKVDVVIMDSPIMLSLLYNKDMKIADGFNLLVAECYNKFDNMNYWVTKRKGVKYDMKGRQQNEKEADEIACSLGEILQQYKIKCQVITATEKDLDGIVEAVLRRYKLNESEQKRYEAK